LVLDEAFDGLDTKSRSDVMLALEQSCESALILIAHRKEDLMLVPKHALLLGQGPHGTDYKVGTWNDMESSVEANFAEVSDIQAAQPRLQSRSHASPEVSPSRAESMDVEIRPPLIEFRNVSIAYQHNIVFSNLDWTVREGENWIVSGSNGSGKSTLIELITGDNPLAYTQDISLFGRKKGSGETIWEIKKQLGVISTKSHMEYVDFADPSNQWYARTHAHISTWDVVCSGLFDSVGLYGVVGASERNIAISWIERLGLGDLVVPPCLGTTQQIQGDGPNFFNLSFGQQKLVLLCRAMVKRPRLLLLDEPTHGLAGENRMRLLHMVEDLASDRDIAIVHVTHFQDELDALGFKNILRL